ncbi:MAG: peptidylprolyl isomerase [Planctomycetota bacterium]|nr:peptidylprolyl isomerase [Planctomycetota bacterium]
MKSAHLAVVAFALLFAAPFANVRAQSAESAEEFGPEVAARGNDTILTWAELDTLLVARRAKSVEGREALRHLAEVKMLEVLGAETGLAASDEDVAAKIREVETERQRAGEKGGLEPMLREMRITLDEFKRLLKLAAVQETLTRRALGLKDTERVNGDQQKLWMDDALLQRNYEEYNPPWKDGVVAKTASFTILEPEFLRYLRLRLPDEILREDCWQLLLAKRMKLRMPDLAPERLKKAIEDELQRRRDDTKRDPRYKGTTWESLLATQGILADRMDQDPGVQIAALSKLWVERSYDDATLQRIYKDERELFDGAYGAAVDTMMIFVKAGAFKNEYNTRNFVEGDKLLADWRSRIQNAEDFQKRAKESSEDATSAENSGALGYVTARTTKVPPEIRSEVAKALPKNPSASAQESMVGPLRVANGCILLWFGSRRPAPAWEAMSNHVKSELRRRFVEEVLPKTNVSGPALARAP